jgi:large subunit ribosomal protein L21
MYAIVEDGGKQYRVEAGDTIYVETRVLPESKKTVDFDRVLMIGEGGKSRIGAPYVEGAKVIAKLDDEVRGPKLEIVKFRRRKGYKLHKGHRQNLLKVTIDKIQA